MQIVIRVNHKIYRPDKTLLIIIQGNQPGLIDIYRAVNPVCLLHTFNFGANLYPLAVKTQ
ncbi:hypothetical protein SDC9_108039 [bioreactor metagenome]|uniref:Uncharacterized protein n=1 Tax=bioreactor metagenome TaxID=1076179 RepID=A0A645BDC5_9ZZZZ